MMPKVTHSAALEPPDYECPDCHSLDCVCDLMYDGKVSHR